MKKFFHKMMHKNENKGTAAPMSDPIKALDLSLDERGRSASASSIMFKSYQSVSDFRVGEIGVHRRATDSGVLARSLPRVSSNKDLKNNKAYIAIFIDDVESIDLPVTSDMTLLDAMRKLQSVLGITFDLEDHQLVRIDKNKPVDKTRNIDGKVLKKGALRLDPPYDTHLQRTKLFTIPLAESVSRSQLLHPEMYCGTSSEGKQDFRLLPYPVIRCVEFIKQHGLKNEGILRLSGSKTKAMDIKMKFDQQQTIEFLPYETDLVASLLKLYLLSLPNAVCPFENYHDFTQVARLENEEEKVAQLKNLVHTLPSHHLSLLQYLCDFGRQIAQHEEENKMTVNNVAVVLGPNIFRYNEELSMDDLSVHSSIIVNVTTLLITQFNKIFCCDPDSPARTM